MVQLDYVLMLYHCPYLLPLRKTKEASKSDAMLQRSKDTTHMHCCTEHGTL